MKTTYDESGSAIHHFSISEMRGIELATVAKMHQWEPIKDIIGAKKCRRCGMTRFKIPGRKAIYAREGFVDNSDTKQNCFILSKD